jgi:hypothetical protein
MKGVVDTIVQLTAKCLVAPLIHLLEEKLKERKRTIFSCYTDLGASLQPAHLK